MNANVIFGRPPSPRCRFCSHRMRPPSRNLCFQRRGHGAALRARSLRPPGRRRLGESRGEAALDVPRLAAEAVSTQSPWPSRAAAAASSTGEMSTFITAESVTNIEHSKSEEVKEMYQMLRSMRWLHSFCRTSPGIWQRDNVLLIWDSRV